MKDSIKNKLVKNELLGVAITSATKDTILEFVVKKLRETRENFFIVTPNPEIVVAAAKNKNFQHALNQAQIALPDGVGITLAGKILNRPLKQRITGVDFMKSLCEKVANQPITVGFLGGRGGVAEVTAERLKYEFPGLKVAFIAEEWSDNEEFKIRNEKLIKKDFIQRGLVKKNQILNSQFLTIHSLDILFIAFGFPKQEFWMEEHLNKIPVRVMMGVGGAFDYLSGNVKRAPGLVQVLGFEWLYRLFAQPWRWKRQLALLAFVWLVVKEKIQLFYSKSTNFKAK